MAKRPDISIVLLAGRQAFRADLNRPCQQPTWVLAAPIDAEASLADAVGSVLQGSPRLAPRVIVLSTEIWSQIVSLPRMSIAGIDAEELEAALRFEAETLSGIEIDQISLAHSPVGTVDDFQQFWVNVARTEDLEEVHELLEKSGCREIVLAHPAGLGGPIDDPGSEPVLEVWNELAYQLDPGGSRLTQVRQLTRDVLESPQQIVLGTPIADDLAQSIHPRWRLEEDADRDQWAAAVARNYLQHFDRLAAPLLRKSRYRSGTPVRHLVAGFLAILVIGFCFWHWNHMHQQNLQLRGQVADLKQPAIDKKSYDDQLVAILEDRAEAEASIEEVTLDLAKVEFFLEKQDDRIATLLRLLIELRKPDLILESINSTEDGLSIAGMSLNGESSQTLAEQLREQALPLGWIVNPAKQQGLEKLTTGGPWTFEIALTDIGPFEGGNSGTPRQPR